MGKRDLKKQYPELNFNFVDLISLLDTTPTKKITPFLVRQFNDWIQYRPGEKMESSSEFQQLRRTFGDTKNELDEIVKRMVFKWARPKLEIIKEFTEHMENNRLPENDINKYDNWNAIKLAVNEAELKSGIKNKKNKVQILHHDDEWLILKPLSIEASVNYGYGTKWCTSMREDNTYFHKYAKDGVLLFVINRKNGVKYAFYSSPKEYSVWTAGDARIDSMETTIPFDLLIKIKGWTNFEVVGPNYDYFDEEDKWVRPKLKTVSINSELRERLNHEIEEEVVPPPMEEPMGEMAMTVEDDDDNSIFVGIRDDVEPMVGYEHPVHGSITEQGERTWSNPYPNGPGGGFDEVPDEVMSEWNAADMDGMVPEMEFDSEISYEENDLPQQAG